jgi:hypothetical protein
MFDRTTGEYFYVSAFACVDGGGNENGATDGGMGSAGGATDNSTGGVGSIDGLVSAGGAVLGNIGPGVMDLLSSGQIDSLDFSANGSAAGGNNGNDGGGVTLAQLVANIGNPGLPQLTTSPTLVGSDYYWVSQTGAGPVVNDWTPGNLVQIPLYQS